jgi:hypothetical protein
MLLFPIGSWWFCCSLLMLFFPIHSWCMWCSLLVVPLPYSLLVLIMFILNVHFPYSILVFLVFVLGALLPCSFLVLAVLVVFLIFIYNPFWCTLFIILLSCSLLVLLKFISNVYFLRPSQRLARVWAKGKNPGVASHAPGSVGEWEGMNPHWRAPKLLSKFKCEYEMRQQKSKDSGHVPWLATLWRVEGHARAPGWD